MIGLFNPKYVIDTGPIIDLKGYYSEVFVSLWENIDGLIRQGEIISTKEVYRELQSEMMMLKQLLINTSLFSKHPALKNKFMYQKFLKGIKN